MSRSRTLVLVIAVLASGTATENATAQAPRLEHHDFRTLVGFDVGYLVPIGDWTKHPFAPVDQFRGGITLGGDLEFIPFEGLGLAVTGSVSRLDTSDWEKYALLQGDDVNASAYSYYLAGVIRPYLVRRPPNLLKLEFGAGYFATDGKESFAGEYYDYDFLVDRFALLLGIQYDRFVTPRLAIAFRIPLLVVPDGVQYAYGERHDVVGAPLTIGLRYAM